MNTLITNILKIVLFCLLNNQWIFAARSSEIAVIYGHPDESLEFVQQILHSTISIPSDSAYETFITTGLFSIFSKEGVKSAVAIEMIPEEGGGTNEQLFNALAKSAEVAPVVFVPFHGPIGENEMYCQIMAGFEKVAFVVPAGKDGAGQSIDPVREPHCLSKNILQVASMNQRDGTLAYFSNYGKGVRLAAPGINIPMTCSGGIKILRTGVIPPVAFATAQLSVFAREAEVLKGAELIEAFLNGKTITLPALGGRVEGNRAIYAQGVDLLKSFSPR